MSKTYTSFIVYGWKGVHIVPCFMENFDLFTDCIVDNIAQIPIYGCECTIVDKMLIPTNKSVVDEGYAKIVEYCKKENIVQPVLGFYPAIGGPLEWY